MAKDLKGTKTHDNLKDAFAGESQANRRYLYFAKIADVEGYPEIASNFRETAEGETGHAHGHLDYLRKVGDPATGLPIGDTDREPEGVGRGRDPRVHRHVPGHGEDRPRGGLPRDRRLVRDPRQGREVARRPLPEDAVARQSRRAAHAAGGRLAAPVRPRRPRRPPHARRQDRRHHEPDRQAGFLPADRRAFLRPRGGALLGRRGPAGGGHADLRGLPRLPHVLQVLRQLPDPVRPHRQEARRRRPQAHRPRDGPGDGRVLPVQAVRGAVPVHAARQARVPARLPEARAPLQGAAGEDAGHPAPRPHPREPRRGRDDGPPQLRHGQRHEQGDAPPHVHAGGARDPQGQAAARLRAHHLREVGGGEPAHPAEGRTASRRCSSRPATCRTTSPRSGATPSR